MALVYCPRTHARFLQSKYPLAEILAAGVRVAIGTDSRATNPDLDFLTELRWTAQRHSEVSPENVLALGTTEAARALGDDERGCIAVHKRADLVVVESSGGNGNPWGWLVDDATPRIIAVVREGRPLGSA